MAEPTTWEQIKDWVLAALAIRTGWQTFADRRKRAETEAIDARIREVVNPPLLNQTLQSLQVSVAEVHAVCKAVDGKVDVLDVRVAKIEAREEIKTGGAPRLSVRAAEKAVGNGSG